MKHAGTGLEFAICSLMVLASPAIAQSAPDAAVSKTAAPVAYVYIQTNKGVDLYDAAASGKLTLVKGSPFKTSGEMIGSNGKYFITLGTFWVHIYPVASNGAIGKQVSTINTQNYDGAACGSTSGASLDHSGQTLYVVHYNAEDQDGNGICTAYQAFNIAKASGALAFNDAVVENTTSTGPESRLAFAGNDKIAWAINDFYEPSEGDFFTGITGFDRRSNGALEPGYIFWDAPLPPEENENLWVDLPEVAAPDPTNHVAIALQPVWDPPKGTFGPVKIGSFTADSAGNLTTTNTWKSMPTPVVGPWRMKMSPAGNLLAVASGGLEIFHFNGAHPITPYKVIQTNVDIGPIQWDKTNHLYALAANALYVYNITPAAITQAPGSPLAISGIVSNALVVVPK